MTDYDVVVANALAENDTLTSLLGDGENGIYNTYCDFKGNFPLVIFQKRAIRPVFYADNHIKGYSVTYTVTVCAKRTEANDIADAVMDAMEDAGFSWTYTDTEYYPEFNEFYTVMTFIIGEEL